MKVLLRNRARMEVSLSSTCEAGEVWFQTLAPDLDDG